MQQEPTIPQSSSQITHDLQQMPPANTPLQPEKKPPKREGFKSIVSTLLIVILAPIIALLLINFVFQSYEVDGPSMEKTLQNTDRLIVWKVPRTIARLSGKDYIPNRYDIIIFTKKGSFQSEQVGEKQLIKRVIGLPGDRVVVDNGNVTVYNNDHPTGFNPDAGRNYEQNLSVTNGNVDITVNEDEVFVMGDNRSNSLDSRIIGSVKSEDIVGKLEFRIFPFNKFEQF